MEAKYLLSLNYEGVDYQVEVQDFETANLLLNDHQAVKQYIESMVNSENYVATNSACSSLPTSESNSQMLTSEPESKQSENDIIWTKKKPTERDNKATLILLSQRQKMEQLFSDKKTRKSKLWNDICKVLEEQNFNLGNKGGERCRQKFANLQKAYLSYIKHQKTTGTGKNDDVPPFFDELHSILGGKHKVNPTYLEDSMDDTEMSNVDDEIGNSQSQTQTDLHTDSSADQQEQVDQFSDKEDQSPNTPEPTPSTSKNYSDRFKKRGRKLTPTKNEFLKEIQADRKNRTDEFSFLKKHLAKSEKQRDRFLDILEHAFGMENQTKHESSDSD